MFKILYIEFLSMNLLKKISLKYLLLIFFFLSTINAQIKDIKFEHLSVEQGLSQSSVFTIFQDNHGFIWFGTEDGLNRYDGYEFKIFRNELDNPQSLNNANIFSLYENADGMMWIGTEKGGVNKYDRSTNKFSHYIHNPNDSTGLSNNFIPYIFGDKEQNVWALTVDARLHRLDKKKDKFIRYRHDPNDPTSISNDQIYLNYLGNRFLNAVYLDSDGILWIGTPNGLNRYNYNEDNFKRYEHNAIDPSSISNSGIIAVTEDSEGDLWIGTINGLNQFDKENETFIKYVPNPSNPDAIVGNVVGYIYEDSKGLLWLSTTMGLNRFDKVSGKFTYYYHNPNDPNSLRSNYVLPMFEDQDANIWYQSFSGGIDRYIRGKNIFTHHVHNLNDPHSLSWNYITSHYKDKTGVFWIGTQGGGVNKYTDKKEYFKKFVYNPNNPKGLYKKMVRAIYEDHLGNLLIGFAEGGLNKYDIEKGTVKNYQHDHQNPNSLSNNNIWAICEDKNGNIWLGTYGSGLTKFNPKNETFKHYYFDSNNPNSINSNLVRSLYADENGYIWIGTDFGGLNKFDTETEKFIYYTTERGDPEEVSTISNNIIRALFESKTEPGILWIGTDGGLNKFNINKKEFTHYTYDPDDPNSISNNRIMSIYEDREGTLWVGTFGGGLNKLVISEENIFGERNVSFIKYTEKDGLPNNVVYGILEDERGNLWLSTNKGISKFNPGNSEAPTSRPTFTNYDEKDGLQSNEFNGGAYFKSKSGQMYFGGINGFNSFFPDSIMVNPHSPKIAITGFRIFNQPVEISKTEESPLRKSITETEEIVLTHKQNVLSFEFVALHYAEPTKNNYAYMLEGVDEDWNFAGTRRFANYANLSPGSYVFRVKGSNNNGVWNNEGASISLIITPPWWKTTWAYLAYTMIFVSGFFFAGRIHRAWLLKKERDEAQIREAQLRAEAAELQSKATEAHAKALKAENDRKTHELEEARKLQLSMLPKEIPQIPHLDIAVYMKTATEVGGDYYDFQVDKDGALIIAIGDATGHGLKAGTMVSAIKALFCANVCESGMEAFFEKSTHTIKQMHLWNLYMGLTLLKIKDNNLTASIAGMPPIYIYRAADKSLEKILIKGMPLGAFSDFPYTEKGTDLHKGDVILMLTDGLAELFNQKKEIYGYEKIESSFLSSVGKSPREIIDHLVKNGEQWSNGGPPNDDITFIVVQIK